MKKLSIIIFSFMMLVGLGCANQQVTHQSTQDRQAKARDPDWRYQMPKALDKERDLPKLEIKKGVLKSGLSYHLIEQVHLPIVEFIFSVRLEPAEASAPGTRFAAFQMLPEGTLLHSAEELELMLAQIGAALETSVDRDGGRVSIRGRSQDQDKLLAILAEVILNPKFDEHAFEVWKARHLESLKAREAEPSYHAERAMWDKTFPRGAEAFVSPLSGTIATIKDLNASDVKDYWQEKIQAQRSTIIAVGDLEVINGEKLDTLFHAFLDGARYGEGIAMRKGTVKDRAFVVSDFPDAAQTVVMLSRPFLKATDLEVTQGRILNAVFSGLFSSRLNLNLREDKHWTYGTTSYFYRMKKQGPAIVTAQIQSDKVAEALIEIAKEFQRMQTEAVTEQELKLAKADLISGLRKASESNSGLAAQQATLFERGLPSDYIDQEIERIEKITVEDLIDFAKETYDLEQWKLFLVGDRSQLEGVLKREDIMERFE